MQYCVTICRYGYLLIEADSVEDAEYIANHQMTEEVNWSDDWSVDAIDPAKDIFVEEDLDNSLFITEPAF